MIGKHNYKDISKSKAGAKDFWYILLWMFFAIFEATMKKAGLAEGRKPELAPGHNSWAVAKEVQITEQYCASYHL